MSIATISIRNFRSIISLNEKVCGLNIFVGQNDEGKSNVLRALDLFFNYGRDDGYDFDWNRDFCCFAPKRKQKAHEITIEIEIVTPTSFANRNPVIWKKVWRREGLHSDSFEHKDGTEITPKSKIGPFLKSMRFDYVPAIKGKDYFQSLMTKLHDMLEATVEEQVHAASGSFTDTINANTKIILEEIKKRLDLETTIQLPANLRELFAQLEFTSVSGEKPFSLNQRGDGIKVRHIPIVLRWLAQQANHLSAKGRPKTVTVWGYEEPENNLELRRCYDLAQEFVDGCEEIQTFVTTHSPAFYSVFRNSDPSKVCLFLVAKSQSLPTTKVQPLADGDLLSLDSSMGLLALLEPHFKEAREELTKLRSAVNNLTDTSKPTIFCEGPSDKKVFEEALRLFFPTNTSQVSVRCSAHHGGGHAYVSDSVVAWSFSRPTAKAIGIFDGDTDAKQSKTEAEGKMNNPQSGKKAFTISLKPGDELKKCFSYKIIVPFGLEELFPKDIWNFAETKGWLEDRSNPLLLYNFSHTDITFNDHINSTLQDAHCLRLALKKVVLERKEALAKHVCEINDEAEKKRILIAVKTTLQECLERLTVI